MPVNTPTCEARWVFLVAVVRGPDGLHTALKKNQPPGSANPHNKNGSNNGPASTPIPTSTQPSTSCYRHHHSIWKVVLYSHE
ncbi:hypothetical protein E2C01_042454 [Portunus trituberculatus]|uniref:Uncharacterized protein n=1 Tax=Portunus trituberculatus TaxID=210409 RepID=A0A5B7FWJ7_PORTR|nr:hypothetical protein [Portunus trituberculatus]